jgi:hypothetical protein
LSRRPARATSTTLRQPSACALLWKYARHIPFVYHVRSGRLRMVGMVETGEPSASSNGRCRWCSRLYHSRRDRGVVSGIQADLMERGVPGDKIG